MNTLDTLGFCYRLIFSGFDLTAWLWGILIFLFSFFFIGLFWGMMWNRSWGIFAHAQMAFFNLLLGVALAAVTLAWFGAERSAAWIELQREVLTRRLAASGIINREVFHNAWDILQPLGSEDELTPPAENGNELRLKSERDAKLLTFAAADVIKRHLLAEDPFAFGVPCFVRDPHIVAEDVVNAVRSQSYPVIVAPDNEWTKAAIASQVATAFDATAKDLYSPVERLKAELISFGILLFLFQLVLVPVAATNDIKEELEDTASI